MLDKEVVQFTKNGMIQHDLATGEKKQLTVSDYGKQLRYENHENTYKHQSTTFTPISHQKRFYLRTSTRGEKHYGDSKDTIMNGNQTIAVRKAAIRPYLYKRAQKAQKEAAQSRSSKNTPSFTDTSSPEYTNGTQQYTEQKQASGYDVGQHLQADNPSVYFADVTSTSKIRSAKASVAAHILNKASQSAEAAAKAASANYNGSSNPALYAGATGLSATQQAASIITSVKLSKSQKERLGAAALARRKKASNSSVALSEETEQQAASSGKTALKAFGREIIASSSKKSVLSIICVIMLPLLVLLMVSSAFGALTGSNSSSVPLPAAVQNYRPVVSVYAAQFGMTDYVDLILAVMAQESGGEGLDPMQAAEGAYNTKYPKQPNGITDPQYSIWCGIQELKSALNQAGCTSPYDMEHIKLALQGYNYGPGFITWAQSHGGYSEANALQFSNMMAKQQGWSSYGDPQYVNHVLQYYAGIGGGLGYTDVSFQNVKQIGESLLGTPYVLGGNTPGVAMDCSSFVCYVYTKAGKNMPRTTAQGIYDQYCTPISPSEAKAGDLIFFQNTYNCSETITHVGIYCGNGVMLEEGGSHVQYVNCSSSYWQSHFYAYGRVK